MSELETLLIEWREATANLKYGEQRVFVDVLTLVEQDKKKDLIYGQDYYSNGVCLVNAAGALLSTGGGEGVPMANFAEVVSLYDQINRGFRSKNINKDQYVSPLAAEILLQYFAPIKETPIENVINDVIQNESFAQGLVYTEPTDEEMARSLMEMLSTPPPADVTPFDDANFPKHQEFVEKYVKGE